LQVLKTIVNNELIDVDFRFYRWIRRS